MRIKLILILGMLILPLLLNAQIVQQTTTDSILGHAKQHDASGKLLAWYQPDVTGAGYV